jgi:hypothetical protein
MLIRHFLIARTAGAQFHDRNLRLPRRRHGLELPSMLCQLH